MFDPIISNSFPVRYYGISGTNFSDVQYYVPESRLTYGIPNVLKFRQATILKIVTCPCSLSLCLVMFCSDHTMPHIPYVGCFDAFLSSFCNLGLCVLHETQYSPRDWARLRVAMCSCVLLLSCLELHCLVLLSWRVVCTFYLPYQRVPFSPTVTGF